MDVHLDESKNKREKSKRKNVYSLGYKPGNSPWSGDGIQGHTFIKTSIDKQNTKSASSSQRKKGHKKRSKMK